MFVRVLLALILILSGIPLSPANMHSAEHCHPPASEDQATAQIADKAAADQLSAADECPESHCPEKHCGSKCSASLGWFVSPQASPLPGNTNDRFPITDRLLKILSPQYTLLRPPIVI